MFGTHSMIAMALCSTTVPRPLLYSARPADIIRRADCNARFPTPPLGLPDEAASRDSQIDALLVDGLDRYFNGRYEDAIHLWTRVLFLDRTHARARAYIDRAKTALNELQRRSEELLQASRDLLDQGQTEAARELLTEAIAVSADDAQAAALRCAPRALRAGPGPRR